MKHIKVITRFLDAELGAIRESGEEFEVTEERCAELLCNLGEGYIEVCQKPKAKATKKKDEGAE